MNALETLRARLPEAARDIGLNVSGVLGESSLGLAQKWGVAYATALAARNAEVTAAVKADAEAAGVEPGVLEDARVAAAVMAMNNVYYRFRHFVAKPATNKADLELFCLAVSAVNGCEQCVRSHEDVILRAGLSEEQVHDAVRVGATMAALATSLEFA
jgi:alkyl hydroperoxide reductase subunit D